MGSSFKMHDMGGLHLLSAVTGCCNFARPWLRSRANSTAPTLEVELVSSSLGVWFLGGPGSQYFTLHATILGGLLQSMWGHCTLAPWQHRLWGTPEDWTFEWLCMHFTLRFCDAAQDGARYGFSFCSWATPNLSCLPLMSIMYVQQLSI